MKLINLRKKIDNIDGQIVRLLNKRVTVAKKVGKLKSRTGAGIYVPDREVEIYNNILKKSKGPLSKSALKAIYTEIMSGSISLEKNLKIAYLGPEATFTNLAAKKKFGSQVEYSPVANVPPTQTCMNCHTLIGLDKKSIDPIRESWATGKPIEWVRVHNLPNYAYFNHSAHVTAGIGCVSCHGNVRQMPIITQKKPLSMGWCLECHRNPDPHLRPVSEMTNMEWEPPADHEKFVAEWKQQKNINPPTDCSGCHR